MANAFKSYVSSSIGTSNTTIITSTASTTVIGCSLANVTATAIYASAFVQKSVGGGVAYIVKNAPIPAGGALVVVGGDQKIVLEVGDAIKAYANTASSVDSLISTLEIS
jgi:hypothetical protein